MSLAREPQSTVVTQTVEPVPELNEFDFAYYGWRVVLAACLGVMGGFGSLFVYTFTVFVKPLGAEFGWNRESVSLGFAIAAMTVGISSPLIGLSVANSHKGGKKSAQPRNNSRWSILRGTTHPGCDVTVSSTHGSPGTRPSFLHAAIGV